MPASRTRPAMQQLRSRIKTLDKKCRELLKADEQDAKDRVFHRHCRRIWEQLEPKERDMIRADIVKEHPYLRKNNCNSLIENYCTKVIQECLQKKKGRG